MNTIFAGDPGVGKSTILNGLVGSAVFRSGVSYGSGLTQRMQSHKAANGNRYTDTPGLGDSQIMEQAAKEIVKALKLCRVFKLVFVVSGESSSGRVRSLNTINNVLNALPDNPARPVHFGIIVNKLRKKVVRDLNQNRAAYDSFVGCFHDGVNRPTSHIHFYEFVSDIEDEENAIHKPTPGLVSFLDDLPANLIDAQEVGEVCDLATKHMREEKQRELEREQERVQQKRREEKAARARHKRQMLKYEEEKRRQEARRQEEERRRREEKARIARERRRRREEEQEEWERQMRECREAEERRLREEQEALERQMQERREAEYRQVLELLEQLRLEEQCRQLTALAAQRQRQDEDCIIM